MASTVNPIRVRDLKRLHRAFALADKAVKEDLRDALTEAAAPVKSDAKQFALREITNVRETGPGTSAWSDFRVGIARGGAVVYVAPVERGVKGRGRERFRRGEQFGTKLMEEAMKPALEKNKESVSDRLEQMLHEVADVWERA